MKQPAGVAGRIDPMVVPLPANATFTLRADLDGYSAPADNVWTLNLKPGQYSLHAEYSGVGVPLRAANGDMKGLSLVPYWTGAVVSDTVTFDVR